MFKETSDPPEISDNYKEENSLDFSKMLELFNLFSTIFSNNDNKDENKDKVDFNDKNIQPNFKTPDTTPTILFDESIHNQQLKVIKAAIPYLSFSHQRMLGILVKSLELKRVFDIYKINENPLSSTSIKSNPNWKLDMLNSIKLHCNKEKQYVVDMLIKIMDIGELMKKINELKFNKLKNTEEVNQSPNQKEELIKAFTPMLNDNQKQIFNMLNMIMEENKIMSKEDYNG
ncbi:hypothetical protein [Defluviitalea phaphyphila]|uniref:hypothetical protein n=1 Tax=Defluviitalea phaphyphila TaxID=1473580 RepID=UPI0007313878|nr:hypothetical protein [Defluviitalea phaphyphila]